MSFWDQIRDEAEFRKLAVLYALVLLLWISAVWGASSLATLDEQLDRALVSSDQVLNSAILYRAAGSSGGAGRSQTQQEPLSALSDIVDTLELRERLMQLQANASGIALQIEKLYGEELAEFLTVLDRRGLKIKNADIRSLPSGDDRLLSITMLLEQDR